MSTPKTPKTPKTTLSDSAINTLLANHDKLPHSLLAQAQQQLDKEQQEKQVEQLKVSARNVTNAMDAAKVALKAARAAEAKAKAYLVAVDSAKNAFIETADYAAFEAAVRQAQQDRSR